MTNCPKSGTAGKRMERITLESLLLLDYQSHIGSGQWFFCSAAECPVVYFDAQGETLEKSALSVRVGIKESESPRPLCYCFEHSAEELEAEVAATGTSTVPDSITEKCRQGLHKCEVKNPAGRCCLGVIRATVKGLQGAGTVSVEEGAQDCCAVPSDPPRVAAEQPRTAVKPSGGRLAAGGAVVSAILSSACCWLPLLLLLFGASAAGVSGFFERYCSLFLGLSTVFLAAGFYLVYRKSPACEPGDACSVPNPRLMRINKLMLWVAAAFVAIFALFPNYIGVFLGSEPAGTTASVEAAYDLEFGVEGMTCEACAVTLRSELAELPGVSATEVSYSSGQAKLRFASPESRPDAAAISKVVEDAGYTAVLPEPGLR